MKTQTYECRRSTRGLPPRPGRSAPPRPRRPWRWPPPSARPRPGQPRSVAVVWNEHHREGDASSALAEEAHILTAA